jgi:hypothetical protein
MHLVAFANGNITISQALAFSFLNKKISEQ